MLALHICLWQSRGILFAKMVEISLENKIHQNRLSFTNVVYICDVLTSTADEEKHQAKLNSKEIIEDILLL